LRVAVGILILTLAVGLLSPGSAFADPGTCSPLASATGTCPTVGAHLTDDEAVLHGTQPGGGGSGSGSGTGSSGAPTPPPGPCAWVAADGTCERGEFEVFSLPVPTLSDIAAFRPTAGVDHMQPDGWFVVGLDANFYATGGSSVVPGTLLGYPANVRFTPIRWQWHYGDGTSATRSTRGATWAAQGIPEFDPTPTSHVYTVPGTYYIDLTIGYRAEYNFSGSGWATIAGTLWLPANRLVATVGSAKTVLVERDCTLSPPGPGCST
jgi:hypothetical protein